MTVDFSEQEGWIGEVSEMELVSADLGIISRTIKSIVKFI